ncbi:Bug family tripartite tricarboxylate transporter substrate binding protein [Ottowia thiooxydans]|uniref:Bug family tripartite tricarboxylate transporter substrate binding protein n=1 Tax=Ottowia thiooxydans TaxID=219182 RepID=UPI00041B37BD|nr:tripartite tricarboxylate transporter substrate binding protein [Ottowia thiooxydans]
MFTARALLRSTRTALGGLLLPLVLIPSGAALAQSDYPNRPIRLIVPFTPSGGVDTLARLMGEHLSRRLGQPFVIDNRPGAGTTIGSVAVARSAPDGYTLLMASSSFTAATGLYPSVGYRIDKDFAPVALLANSPVVLAVSPKFKATNLAELVQAAKDAPGKLTTATYGNGSTPHLVSELFQQMTGTKFLNVPYKGGGPAVLSTLMGETDMLFPSILPVRPHVASGKLKILAIGSAKPSSLMPGVPTFKEQGVDLVTGTWFGVVAPAKTPPAVIERLNKEILALAKEPEFVKAINGEGAEFVGGTPAEFGTFLQADLRRWTKIIADQQIKAE